MELRVIGRGALAGFLAGILGFVFAKIFAEPLISKAIDYETGRGAVLDALNRAAGRPVAAEGPEIFSRDIQTTIGVATGVIAFSTAMGALVAVAYVVLHGRFTVQPRTLAMVIPALGFIGVYLIPFVKYPANPPAIGHDFTIVTRGHLFLAMVGCSLVVLVWAVFLARKLVPRFGTMYSTIIASASFLVIVSIVMAILPSLGDLTANVSATNQFGFARAATETPQPITNILTTPLTVNGKVIAPGQLVFPGFDADLLWKFRFYSVVNQLIVWGAISLVFGALVDRMFRVKGVAADDADQPVAVTS